MTIKTIFKTQFSKILLCIIVLGTLLPACAEQNSIPAVKKTRFHRVAKKLNLSSQDLTISMILSSGLFSASFLTSNQTAKIFLRVAAIVPPVVAAALPKSVVEKLAQIPGLKQYFQLCAHADIVCKNKECEGFCTECKARRSFLIVVPLTGIISLFIQFIAQEHAKHIAHLNENIRRKAEQIPRLDLVNFEREIAPLRDDILRRENEQRRLIEERRQDLLPFQQQEAAERTREQELIALSQDNRNRLAALEQDERRRLAKQQEPMSQEQQQLVREARLRKLNQSQKNDGVNNDNNTI